MGKTNNDLREKIKCQAYWSIIKLMTFNIETEFTFKVGTKKLKAKGNIREITNDYLIVGKSVDNYSKNIKIYFDKILDYRIG